MFHVPESARDRFHPILGSTKADGNNGAFDLPSCEPGWRLAIIASDGSDPTVPEKWEHVSVHAYHPQRRRERTPTWKEMCFVKGEFWDDEDVVIQYHPRKSEYVNCHAFTLHLWRPINETLPTPPPEFVGPRVAV